MDKRESKSSKSSIPTTSATLLNDIGGDLGSPRWSEFANTYRPMMDAFLKSQYPGLEGEDIIQETLAALAQVLPEYVYDPKVKGAFHFYLRRILENKAADALKKQQKRKLQDGAYARAQVDAGNLSMGAEEDEGGAAGAIPVLAVSGDAPGTTKEEWMEVLFHIALSELRQELRKEPNGERQWQIFWRTWSEQETTEEVMDTFGVSRDVVYKTRERVKKRLMEIVKGLKDRV